MSCQVGLNSLNEILEPELFYNVHYLHTRMNSTICSLVPSITVMTPLYPVVRGFSSVSEEMELNGSSSSLEQILGLIIAYDMGRVAFCEWKNAFGRYHILLWPCLGACLFLCPGFLIDSIWL